MSENTEKQKDALEAFKSVFGGTSSKVTASEVMQGLTQKYDLEMISNIPRPEIIVKARLAENLLDAIGYSAESKLVNGLIGHYVKAHVSQQGKNNRAKNIIDAFASLFRAELEIEKSKKGMFTK